MVPSQSVRCVPLVRHTQITLTEGCVCGAKTLLEMEAAPAMVNGLRILLEPAPNDT